MNRGTQIERKMNKVLELMEKQREEGRDVREELDKKFQFWIIGVLGGISQ